MGRIQMKCGRIVIKYKGHIETFTMRVSQNCEFFEETRVSLKSIHDFWDTLHSARTRETGRLVKFVLDI